VITVYAAAAFVILELVDIITEPFGLPEWTMILVVVLLIVGFIITVIVSWIYDLHPEGGMVKTESADKVSEISVQPSSNSWKIASYISFVVIVGLVVLNVISRSGKKEILDKSIAVLPFQNISPDQGDEHIISGTMESILNNLCKIKDLRVVSRSSVEQYRGTQVFIPEVAEKLGISYVLEGSMQKYGNQIRLTIQLINKDDKHLWSEQYDREITQVEEYYSLYSEIARLVAEEIEAIITPEEEELIEKVPTSNMNAYYLYQKGNEEYFTYHLIGGNTTESLQRAEDLYNKAISYDSSFAQAYIGLANVQSEKSFLKDYHSEIYLDSALTLSNIALSLDPNLADGYSIRGYIFFLRNQRDAAELDINRALELNPNDWRAYEALARMYRRDDHVKALENFYKAANLNRGPGLVPILQTIANIYYQTGFIEQVDVVGTQIFELTGDSTLYYYYLGESASLAGNIRQVLQYQIKSYEHDSSRQGFLYEMAGAYAELGEFGESLKYYEKYLASHNDLLGGAINNIAHRIGYAYWGYGDTVKANYYFDMQLKFSLEQIELDRIWATLHYFSYYDLAAIYAFRGDFQKSLEYLRIFNQRKTMEVWCVSMLKNDPLFKSIQNEPEFQEIVRDVESKYQAERERVRQWLEENDML
jgi:TolB-like protein